MAHARAALGMRVVIRIKWPWVYKIMAFFVIFNFFLILNGDSAINHVYTRLKLPIDPGQVVTFFHPFRFFGGDIKGDARGFI